MTPPMRRKNDETMLSNHHSLSWRRGAIRERYARSLLVLSLAWSLSLSATVQGFDDDNDEPKAVVANRVTLSETDFDQHVYGNRESRESAMKAHFDALERAIARLKQDCGLSEAQQRKLRLAGKGDILQAFDAVTELRRKVTGRLMTEKEFEAQWSQVDQLREQMWESPFDESSLFVKTQRRLLSDEQRATVAALQAARQRKLLENTVLAWDGRRVSVPKLTEQQRQQFLEVVLPKLESLAASTLRRSAYLTSLALLQAAELQDELKPILTDSQWGEFQSQIQIARQMEPTLKQKGLWPIPESSTISSPDADTND